MSDTTVEGVDRAILPAHREHYYGGEWHAPKSGRYAVSTSPATQEAIAEFADGDARDVDAAVVAAQCAFREWRRVPPLERAKVLRSIAQRISEHAKEFALLDALDGGNPIREMMPDVMNTAARFEFFAGLVTEAKGDTIPMGPDALNYTLRQPVGVVARVVAFNHPFMFSATRMAAPLAAGNAVIIKPPEQAPLSALRLMEVVGDLLPPGTVSMLTGGREVGQALAEHADIAMIGLVGSVPTGKHVMRSASGTLKKILLELGGKNALIAYPDADPEAVAAAAVRGMNLGWCGQSCGSTSRIFLHEDMHDTVLEAIVEAIKGFVPGIPTERQTTMGAIISQQQYASVRDFVQAGMSGGARLVAGGSPPSDEALERGNFLLPTVFADVTQDMRIAADEIFGPVMSVLKWRDEVEMLRQVNAVPYGLTCSIWTRDLARAHRTADEVEAGYVWVNEVSRHFLGAPFGGWKQSGIGREENLGELLSFTQEKNVHVNLNGRNPKR